MQLTTIVAVVTVVEAVVEAVVAAIVSAAPFQDLEFADFVGRERGWKAGAHAALPVVVVMVVICLVDDAVCDILMGCYLLNSFMACPDFPAMLLFLASL